MSRQRTYLASVLMGRIEDVEVTATSASAAIRKIEGFGVPILAYTGNGEDDGMEDMRNWGLHGDGWFKVLSIKESVE